MSTQLAIFHMRYTIGQTAARRGAAINIQNITNSLFSNDAHQEAHFFACWISGAQLLSIGFDRVHFWTKHCFRKLCQREIIFQFVDRTS